MTTEKLTGEELVRLSHMFQTPLGRKALNLLKEQIAELEVRYKVDLENCKLIDELKAENERLRYEHVDLISRYGENTEKMILAEARVRELEVENERWKDMVHTISPELGIARLRLETTKDSLTAATADRDMFRQSSLDEAAQVLTLGARLTAVRELAERWTTFGVAGDCRRALLALLTNQPAALDIIPRGWRRTLAGGLAWCGEDEPMAPTKEEKLQASGFEPVTENSGGYTVGDALGIPRYQKNADPRVPGHFIVEPHVGVTAWGEPTPEHMRQPTAPARTECTCWDAGLMGAPCPVCRENVEPTRTDEKEADRRDDRIDWGMYKTPPPPKRREDPKPDYDWWDV